MTFRSEQRALVSIKWVETKRDSLRTFIVARVPQLIWRGADADRVTGQYLRHERVTVEKDQPCYVWRNTTKGALIASLCDRACDFKLSVQITYDEMPWGWKLTDAALVEPATAA